ncbi:MAG: hypothetical protein DDT19_02075 [Syntrophomonadaceae bacterium]|nr:hypothetical protein [Bacillota bacterium]
MSGLIVTLSTVDSTMVLTCSPAIWGKRVLRALLRMLFVNGSVNALYAGSSVRASEAPTTPAPTNEVGMSSPASLICRYFCPRAVIPKAARPTGVLFANKPASVATLLWTMEEIAAFPYLFATSSPIRGA